MVKRPEMRKSVLLVLFCVLCTACKAPDIRETEVTDPPEVKRMTAAKINIRLGMAYIQRKDVIRAKQKFLTALQEAPQLPEAWYAMAYFQEQTSNLEKANQYYQRALKLAPDRGDVLNNYGTFLCRQGKYQLAIVYFNRATHDPEYLDPSAAYENAGLCAQKIPDYALAIHYFKKSLERDPAHTSSLLAMAEVNYLNKNYSQAARQLKQYRQVAPANPLTDLLAKKLEKQIPT